MVSKNKSSKLKQIIGRRTLVDFPDLEVMRVQAKVDTGAYSNTLHCSEIGIRANKLWFKVMNEREHCIGIFTQKNIKNSFGKIEKRYLIKTKIKIAGRVIKSIISLTNRKDMRYPALIGRRLLKNKFIVDVSLNK
jgi:hypothetical protein